MADIDDIDIKNHWPDTDTNHGCEYNKKGKIYQSSIKGIYLGVFLCIHGLTLILSVTTSLDIPYIQRRRRRTLICIMTK